MVVQPDSKKRKRDEDHPEAIITFSAQNRTFDRILRDQSFSEVENVVRKKLGLAGGAKLSLAQLRDGREVDLEDEDDFEAFKMQARFFSNLNVVVRVEGEGQNVAQKPTAAVVGSTSKTIPITSVATTQVTSSPSVPAQPVAGPSSRPWGVPDPQPRQESSSLPRPKQTAKKTSTTTSTIQPPSSTMPPPPVPPTATEDSVVKKRRKKTRRSSASDRPSATPEPSSNLNSTEPTPVRAPEKRKAESATGGADLAAREPPKKKKKQVVIDAPPSAAPPPSEPDSTVLAQPDSEKKKKNSKAAHPTEQPDQTSTSKQKGKSKVDIPAASQDVPPERTEEPVAKEDKGKGKGKEAQDKAVKKKKGKAGTEKVPSEMSAETKASIWDVIQGIIDRKPTKAKATTSQESSQSTASPSLPAATSSSTPPEVETTQGASKTSKSSKSKSKSGMPPAASDISATNPPNSAAAVIEPTAATSPKVSKGKAKSAKAPASTIQADVSAANLSHTSAPPVEATHAVMAETATPKSVSKKGPRTKDTPCPVCLNTPFHFRVHCPIIIAGSESIKARIEELKRQRGSTSLVKDLEKHLAKAVQKEAEVVPLPEKQTSMGKASAKPASIILPPATHPAPSEVSTPLSAVVPAGSTISAVVVESKDEGSSSDSSSDDDSPRPSSKKKTRVPAPPPVASATPSAGRSEADIEALLHGPKSRKSLAAQIPSSDEEEDQAEDDDDEEGPEEDDDLASDREEREERAYRRLSRQLQKKSAPVSSDEESADDPDEVSPEPKKPVTVESTPSVPPLETNSRPPFVSSSSTESVLKEIASGTHDGTSSVNGRPAESSSSPVSVSAEQEVVPSSEPENDDEDEAQPDDDDEKLSPDADVTLPEEEDVLVYPSSPDRSAREPSFEIPMMDEEPASEEPNHDEGIHEGPSLASPPVSIADVGDTEEAPRAAPKVAIAEDASRRMSSDDSEDPIEPAEDFHIPPPISDDPIEFDPPVADLPSQEVALPPSPLKTGTAKRMKDRQGKLDSPNVLSALAERLKEVQSSQNEQPRSSQAANAEPSAENSEPPTEDNSPALRRSGRTRKVSTETSIADTSVASKTAQPEPAKPTRGRPKLTPEEKAQRAAERKAETAAKKQAEKERKAAEKAGDKEAEKERKAAERKEKAAEKARQKAGSANGRGRNASKKAASPEPPESEDEVSSTKNVASHSHELTTPMPSRLAALKRVPTSTAKWETLPPAPDTPEVDAMSMVDELRSSSPDLSFHGKRPAMGTANGRATEDMANGDGTREIPDSQESVAKPQKGRPHTTSLFFPSDTQMPASQPTSQDPFAYDITSSSQSQSQPLGNSNNKGEPKFKTPVRPASSWQANMAPTPTNMARRAVAPFRRLSDLMASQDVLSSSQPLPPPMPNVARRGAIATAEERRESMYGNLGKDDSDSEDETSDSDGDEPSHIPKHRRAGQDNQGKKQMFIE